jgi:hypothetical protein
VLANSTALELQKELNLGSYHTALRLTHGIRAAMGDVHWPQLSRTRVVADDSIRASSKNFVRLWIAAELNGSGLGLIQIVRAGNKPTAAFERIASALEQGSVVLTPPGGHLGWLLDLGFKRRPIAADASELQLVAGIVPAFRRFLAARHHRGLVAASVDAYLSEFVFRNNASVLGWSAKQRAAAIHANLGLA